MKVDLDAVEARLGAGPGKPPWRNWWSDMADMGVELRAIRELLFVKENLLACYRHGTRPSEGLLRRLDKAQVAYDRAVGT